MTKTNYYQRKKIMKFLNENQIPYLEAPEGIHLIVLKSNSKHHYCSIEFNEVDESWYNKRKPFTFKQVLVRDIDQAIKSIKKYLNS